MQKLMRFFIILILIFYHNVGFAQGEANIWYFGINAGLDFNSGVPVAITNGQINTIEGCATISNSSGQILFYTDGVTVWNRNHVVMVNGNGLLGDLSSTQAATIVPKPGSSNIYYIFTTDEIANPNGFRYSEVDISLDSGLGAVTGNKNILIYAPTLEKISVVKHSNGIDFWIVTHEFNNNKFRSYLLTSSGLNTTPIVTGIGVATSNFGNDAIGSMKISPDGSKLAIAHGFGVLQLLDFNTSTGLLSNAQTLSIGVPDLYGVEFSPNSNVLYVTSTIFQLKLRQYDLTSTNVPASVNTIYNFGSSLTALQLGPDGKIYVGSFSSNKIGVINNPNVVGVGCFFQPDIVDLGGKMCKSGLPSFNQSFFISSEIQLQNLCVGQSTQFILNSNFNFVNEVWDFGDGNSISGINPSYAYSSPGQFNVSVTATTSSGVNIIKSKTIVVFETPTAIQPQDIKVCDTDNNGFYNFDLTSRNNAILNGQSSSQYSVRYFASATDYANNIAIATPTSYPNITAYQPQSIIAEVSNNTNGECKATTSFTIQVFESPIPAVATTIAPLQMCDNTSVGTDTDGKVVFNLTQRAATILNGQSATNFSLSYYKDNALTQLIATPVVYTNTNPTETIWVKMTNNQNSDCVATTSFTIAVFSLPVVTSPMTLKQCDDNQDGYSSFNLEESISLISTSTSGLTFVFFETVAEAQTNSNPITNSIAYVNQVVSNDVVFIRVQNANGCFRIVQLNLTVSTTQIPSNFPQKVFTVCDDLASGSKTDGVATFNFSSVDSQIRALFPVGQQLNITYYRNIADALAEQNRISNISSYTNTGYPNSQNIYVRVDSQLNNECLGLGNHITLNVERIPVVQPQTIRHCDDNQDGIYAFNTTNLQNTLLNGLTNVTVTYTDQNGNPLSSPLPNPFATTSQTIAVTVANNTATACNYSSTIRFIVDDLPEVFTLPVSLTTVCDDEADPVLQDGLYPFNTATFQSTILGTQTGMTVNYYDGNNNPLPSPLPNPLQSGIQNIRVEVINPLNNICKATGIIPLVVKPVPNIRLTGEELVCSNNLNFTKVINAGLIDESTSGNYTYTWYLNGSVLTGVTNYSLTVNQEGIYTVKVENVGGCQKTRTITVTGSSIATITDIQVSDLSANNSIVVTVTGQGDYVYSLNNSDFQQSNVFYNVAPGVYTVYVKDMNDCGIADEEVSVLGIPNFFTPNGDGYNDYWNIQGVGEAYGNSATIFIFDRYGKLLKQLSAQGQGWNGVYDNQPVPATDYWYSIELKDGRIFKGHFALKR